MDDFNVVEPVFQRVFDTVQEHGGFEDLNALDALSDAERAIYATRIVEGELDNGGWYQVFGNGVDHFIEPAISGYEKLGLPEYASHLRAVRSAGFSEDTPEEEGDAYDTAYSRLSGSEAARAALVRSEGLS